MTAQADFCLPQCFSVIRCLKVGTFVFNNGFINLHTNLTLDCVSLSVGSSGYCKNDFDFTVTVTHLLLHLLTNPLYEQ